MSIDYDAWRFWFDSAQVVVMAAIGVYVWWANRDRVTNARITESDRIINARITEMENEMEDRIQILAARVTVTEQKIQHAPSRHDIAAIYERVNSIDGSVQHMAGEMKGMNNLLGTIHGYLMEKEK